MGTESTGFAVFDGDAEVARPNGMSHLNGCTFLNGNGLYGRSWTDLRTAITFGTAVATFIAYLWLHEAVQVTAGTQNIVRTGIDTELAGRTMGAEVADGK